MTRRANEIYRGPDGKWTDDNEPFSTCPCSAQEAIDLAQQIAGKMRTGQWKTAGGIYDEVDLGLAHRVLQAYHDIWKPKTTMKDRFICDFVLEMKLSSPENKVMPVWKYVNAGPYARGCLEIEDQDQRHACLEGWARKKNMVVVFNQLEPSYAFSDPDGIQQMAGLYLIDKNGNRHPYQPK